MRDEPDAAAGPALEFARAVHTEMLETNQNLVNRAQIALSLNGVILGVIGAAITGDVDDLRDSLKVFDFWMWLLLCAAGLMLIASIGCCAWVMSSSHWRRLLSLRKTSTTNKPLEPEYMWFYRDIADYLIESKRPEEFIKRAAQIREGDEVGARMRQVLNMATNVRSRARWVNAGFVFLASGLVFFAFTVASYLARVAS